MTDPVPTDLGHALRSLRRDPGLALAAVVTLAVGIGATSVMYSIAHGATRNLPFDEDGRIVAVELNDPVQGQTDIRFDREDYTHLVARQTALDAVGAFQSFRIVVSGTEEDRAREYRAAAMASGSFRALGVGPVIGRPFTEVDALGGAGRVAIVSHRLWERLYGGDPGVLGEVLRLDRTPTEIIGVMPEGFRFPLSQDVWLPLATAPVEDTLPGAGPRFYVFGRLAPGATLERARDELTAVMRRRAEAVPKYARHTVTVAPYTVAQIGFEAVSMIYTMVLVVAFVLVIAGVNVANLLLTRSVARGREIAVRMALGAGRGRLLREQLVESLAMGWLGGLLGLGLAWAGLWWFNRAMAGEIQEFWISIRIDPVVAAYAAAATGLAALLAGVLPALQTSRTDVGGALKEETRGTTSARLGPASRALVVIEIALSCGLLVLAGLMVKGAVTRTGGERGFRPEGVFTARLDLVPPTYTRGSAARFLDELAPRLGAIPSVTHVSFVDELPGVWGGRSRFTVEGRTYGSVQEQPVAQMRSVTPGYFEAFGLEALDGRLPSELDARTDEVVVVVTDLFARSFFPGERAVGRRLGLPGAPGARIVGVVPDAGVMALPEERIEGLYLPLVRFGPGTVWLALRTAGDPTAVTSAVVRAVAALDPDLAVRDPASLEDVLEEQTTIERTFGTLFLVIGLAALALATVGLYGVVSFSVDSRTREIGIRRALGASSWRIVWVSGRGALLQLGAGLALGLPLAFGLAPKLGQALMGTSPTDPWVYSLVPVALSLAMLAATVVPLLRATRVEPVVALTAE